MHLRSCTRWPRHGLVPGHYGGLGLLDGLLTMRVVGAPFVEALAARSQSLHLLGATNAKLRCLARAVL